MGTTEELEGFVTWAAAHDVPQQFLPAYKRIAEQIAAGVDGPIYPRHVDAAIAAQEKAGVAPRELANVQRVGDALVRYWAQRPAEAGAPALTSATPSAAPSTTSSAAMGEPAWAATKGPSRAPPREASALKTLLVIAAIAGVGFGGWWGYNRVFVGAGDAVFVTFDSGRFIVRFVRTPSRCADPTDVHVDLESGALAEPVRFGWDVFASRGMGAKLAVDAPPPLGVDIKVNFDLDDVMKQRMQNPDMRDFLVRARLFWCGRQQDLWRTNVRGQYHELPAAP